MLIQIGGGGLKGDMLLKMSRLEAHILRTGVATPLSLESDSPFFVSPGVVKIMFFHALDSTAIVTICGAAALSRC